MTNKDQAAKTEYESKNESMMKKTTEGSGEIKTAMWSVTNEEASPDHPAIKAAAKMLQDGELVAFPTETVYGLGADARSTSAVEDIYTAKGRPSDNPLIVHIADRAQLAELIADGISPAERDVAERLIARFWPGPLTLVLPARPGAVSPRVTAGLATIAVRMPDHPLALALIRASGCPIAAPSANRSGRPSPTTASHVAHDLAGRIAGIVDGGPTAVGLESTVVAVGPRGMELLRPGSITQQELREAAPQVALTLAPELQRSAAQAAASGIGVADVSTTSTSATSAEAADAATEAPRAPGMKYAHYAPRGEMRVIAGSPDLRNDIIARALELLAEAKQQGRRTGILTYTEHADRYRDVGVDHVAVCGSMHQLDTVARGLYDALRSFDEAGVDYIIAEGCPMTGVGEAIMNRLLKASAHKIEHID